MIVILDKIKNTYISPSADYREEDLLPDSWLAQPAGGVDQSSAKHPESSGQQPHYCGDEGKAHCERLAHKG